MALKMMLIRWTPEGAAGVAKEGLVRRREVMQEYFESRDGRVVDYWGTTHGDWDAVIVYEEPEHPTATTAAAQLRTASAGAIAGAMFLDLAEAEDVDAALRGEHVWRAPGAGP